MSDSKLPADQWKHTGYCIACRKRNYCKKQCKAHRKNAIAGAEDFFLRVTGGKKIQDALRAAKGE